MTLEEIQKYFLQSERFLLTTHESPDGDGLGAEYALCSALLDMGKDALILNSNPHASKYNFFDKKGLIRNLGQEEVLPEDLSERNLIILDTDPSNIGSITELVMNECRDVLVIDHHSPKDSSEHRGWLSPDSSSTCEMVFRILEAMRLSFSKDVAIALFTGIVYDTGSFIYPKTQARTFRIAETLVTSGAIPNEIFTKLFESKSTGALMLQSLVTSTMLLHEDEQAAIQVMPRETLIASGAAYDESQEIVNIPLQCEKVRVSVFFKENERGIRRCSMRSKGEVDCATIAHGFGGGGHKTAAGFRFDSPFADIQDQVLDEIHSYLT